MSSARKPISFEESLALAEAEDALRSDILLKGRVPGARRLGKLLQEHDADVPHPSAASAIAVCQNKRKTTKSISRLHSIKHYRALTLVRRGGTIALDVFSVADIGRMKRAVRRDLKAAGMCKEHPGHFVIDFEFKRSPPEVNLHVHGIIHRLDEERVKQLRLLIAYRSRANCRRPVFVSRRKPNQRIAGYLDYLDKSLWVVRTPKALWRTEAKVSRGYQRLPSPHFDRFLVEIDRVRPDQLTFRVGGGKGRH